MYDDNLRFNGGDDCFDLTLEIFYDLWRKCGLHYEAYGDAFSTMLGSRARDYYYDNVCGRGYKFEMVLVHMRNHFETDERRRAMLTRWNNLSLPDIIKQNNSTPIIECFEKLLDELQKVQRCVPSEYRTDNSMKDRLISACQKVQACAYACFKPAPTYEALCSDLRSSIRTTEEPTDTDQAFQYDTTNQALLTDRRYHTNKLDNRKQQQNSETPGNRKRWTKKKCFV